MLSYRTYLFYYGLILSHSYVLIYHTENTPSTQYYDCIYSIQSEGLTIIPSVKYCRQFDGHQALQRDFDVSCHNGGQLWHFEQLARLGVPVEDVLQWSSSIEQANYYAEYLSNRSLIAHDPYLCNCTNPSSFGKFCEYEFYGDSTSFDDAWMKQIEPRRNLSLIDDNIYVGSQLHNNRPCYITWTCYSGWMCLDWRSICDGKQQCMEGLDEDHCEMLEFNECEDDEYRCLNGMCIPEDYWLDSEYDCMDWTDEMNSTIHSGDLCFDIPSPMCDEHICTYNQWSCGDGQCVSDETDRHDGIRHNIIVSFCKNMRDVNYMCDAVTRHSKSWWTIDGGYCLPYALDYQKLTLDSNSANDICAYAVKCALSNSLDQNCMCKDAISCTYLVSNMCPPYVIYYPTSYPVLSSHVYMCYAPNRDWTKKKPDGLLLYGRVKCIGYQFIATLLQTWPPFEKSTLYDYRQSEGRTCSLLDGYHGIKNKSAPHFDINCWNNSKTFNNRSYHVTQHCFTRCLSAYRIRDGVEDCMISDELFITNGSCSQIQRHRLRCSSAEPTCLLAAALGTWGPSCLNARDEIDPIDGTVLRGNVFCSTRNDPTCAYLRNYIRMSSQDDEDPTVKAKNSTVNAHSGLVIPFRWHCDSFFNDKFGTDELPEFCKQWICAIDEYQCLSGQCILQSWVCDGEWDCGDGSDEQRLFIMDSFSEHNSRLMNLTLVKENCYELYLPSTPFSNLCNITTEYPCFRTDAVDLYNVTHNRPCINLEQIGDGKIDCLSALDERNRMECSGKGMLGFHFQYHDDDCLEYSFLCSNSFQWTGGVKIAYDSVCFYARHRLKEGIITNCTFENDVLCLNNDCMRNARCNGRMECPHGEDEYRCIPRGTSPYEYRMGKKIKPFQKMKLPNYPLSVVPDESNRNPSPPMKKKSRSSHLATNSHSSNDPPLIYEKRHLNIKSIYKIIRDALPADTITFENHYLPFICNHGLAVKYYTGDVVCLCSPSYFGPQCEFYSDRMTVLTHLDLTHYRPSSEQIDAIKVLTTLLFEDRIIDFYEFHVHPQLQDEHNYVKQVIFFQYPRSDVFIQLKRSNRSGTQLYSVRFEAFNLHLNKQIEPIGVWEYPVYFDFLPSFRLAKILRFPSPAITSLNDPCSSNPCGQNGSCQKLIASHRSSYFCSCHNGSYGDHCQSYDHQCDRYCSPKSICKPTYRRLVTNDQHPLCICPASTFGSSCDLTNNHCQSNPCLHGGTCIITYNITDIDHFMCLCTRQFAGEYCQYPRKAISSTLTLSSQSRLRADDVLAVTVSFNDYLIPLLRLDMRHHQVYRDLPRDLELIYDDTFIPNAPPMALMKIYQTNYRETGPEYYILYFQIDQKEINIKVDLTSENSCPMVQTLWNLLPANETIDLSNNTTFNFTIALYSYHRICQAKRKFNATFSCFRDEDYLCLCESDYHRAECFIYNRSIDQCSLCLSNGQCLKGEENIKTDFLCLCPRCYHGSICQYSTEFMSFTVDSLIINDLRTNSLVSCIVYMLIVIFVFLFGLFNNLCGLLTFTRPLPRKVGVGNYLLIVSMIDQCSLLTLLLKMIHIILGGNGTLFYYVSLNRYACKIISYLLSVFTRTTYWLTSFVTIERVCVVLFPTSSIFKHPHLALSMSIFSILLVSAMHVHEVLHYTIIVDQSYTFVNTTVCVTSYMDSLILSYNRINILIHHLIPFFIQIISITVIVIQVAARRKRTTSSRKQKFIDLLKKQFRTHREHYVTPMIIIFSSLPQTILSFLYACTELKQLWQRYALLITIFLSYLPQMLGFILYVLPSKTYSDEFHRTSLGKKLSSGIRDFRMQLNRKCEK